MKCTDRSSPGACGAIFDAVGISPGWGPTAVGTVAITNTGTQASTFQLSLSSATVSPDDDYWTPADDTLCADLQLTISDQEADPHVVYAGGLAAMPPETVVDSGGGAVWGPGATDIFTFRLALPAGSAGTDEDSTCTAVFSWGQNGA